MPGTKIGFHKLNGTKFRGWLHNTNDEKVIQHTIYLWDIAYLYLYSIKHIVKESVVEAQVLTLAQHKDITKSPALIKNRASGTLLNPHVNVVQQILLINRNHLCFCII